MHAYLDGHELKPDRPTLAAGLAVAVRAAENAGRIIVEAWVDGRPLANDELENPSDVPGSALKLELVSAEPRELVAATLLDGVAALDEIEGVQRDAANAIQRGQVQGSIDAIRRVAETWTGVRAILERGSAILGLDLTAASPVPFAPLAQALSRHLGTLKDALQRQDWSMLSDCLGYELTEQARAWREALSGIASAISPASPKVPGSASP
jgi:hypothetical protein